MLLLGEKMENEMTMEAFVECANKEFGDKIKFSGIDITPEDLELLNQDFSSTLTIDDFQNYKQVWILDNKCPVCGTDLLGLWGSFKWGLRHGYGVCSECNKIDIKYYHYIGDLKKPIAALALTGF
jgi:hypothetical protein